MSAVEVEVAEDEAEGPSVVLPVSEVVVSETLELVAEAVALAETDSVAVMVTVIWGIRELVSKL